MANFATSRGDAQPIGSPLRGATAESPLGYTQDIAHSSATGGNNDVAAWIDQFASDALNEALIDERMTEYTRWKGVYADSTNYLGGDVVKRTVNSSTTYLEKKATGSSGAAFDANLWIELSGLSLSIAQLHEFIGGLSDNTQFLGVWGSLPGASRIQFGDVVEHLLAGTSLKVYYRAQVAHNKATSAPDVDTSKWSLIGPVYQGDWRDSWYHEGAMVRRDDRTFVAGVAVARGDPAPDNSSNTKWVDMSSGAVNKARVYAQSKTILKPGGHVTVTSDDDDESITIDAVGGTSSFERVRVDGPIRYARSGSNGVWRLQRLTLHSLGEGDTIEIEASLVLPSAHADYSAVYAQLTDPTAATSLAFPPNVAEAGTAVQSRAAYVETDDAAFRNHGNPTSLTGMPIGAQSTASGNATITDSAFLDIKRAVSELVVYVIYVVKPDSGQGPSGHGTATAAAPSPLDQATAYYGAKAVLKSGENVALRKDDAAKTITVSAPTTRPVAPSTVGAMWGRAKDQEGDAAVPIRFYARESVDRRAAGDAYAIEWVNPKFTLHNENSVRLTGWSPRYPSNPDGYASDKPGVVYDPDDHQFNMNGVAFNAGTSGNSDLEFEVEIQIKLAQERAYSSSEFLSLRTHGYGRVNIDQTETFHFDGGHQDPFSVVYTVPLTAQPRAGTFDNISFDLAAGFGNSGETVGTTIQEIRFTFRLPHLGSNVTQEFGLSNVTTRNVPDLPIDFPDDGAGNVHVADWGIGSFDDNTGRSTQVGETDKAEVNLVSGWRIQAARDLRSIDVTFEAQRSPTDAITWSLFRAQDAVFAPRLVHQWTPAHGIGSALWSERIRVMHLLQNEYIFLVGTRAVTTLQHLSAAGNPKVTWDPNIIESIPARAQVIPGILGRYLVGIGTHINRFAIGQPDVVPHPDSWRVVRVWSGGLYSAVQWHEATVPTGQGQPGESHPHFGPFSIRALNHQGTIVHNRMLGIYNDSEHGYTFSLYVLDGDNAAIQDLGGFANWAEIEYVIVDDDEDQDQ